MSDAVGALVVSVLPGLAADRAGVMVGDIIVAVDGQPVMNDEAVSVLLRSGPDRVRVLTLVSPDDAPRSVELMSGDELPVASLLEFADREIIARQSVATRVFYASNRTDDLTGRAILQDVVVQVPTLAEAHAALAQSLFRLAQVQADSSMTTPVAIRAAISRALALDPASESVLLTAAEVYDALGDRAQAMKAAQDAITLNNGSARAHHLLGIAHLGAGQADVALPSLRRAVDLDPYAQEYYRSLSAGYRALGQLDFAQQTDRAVEGMRPDGPHTSSGGHPRRVGVAMGVAVLGGTFAALLLGKPAPVRPARRQSRVRLVWRWVDGLGALALFSVLVPTLGRAIALSPGSPVATEVIGHVVPGLLVLALWVGAVRCLSRGGAAASYLDCMAVAAGFSGLWIISTHLQLLVSAFGGTGSVQSALFHSFAGPAMVVTAVLLYRASPGRRGDTPLVSPAIGDAPA